VGYGDRVLRKGKNTASQQLSRTAFTRPRSNRWGKSVQRARAGITIVVNRHVSCDAEWRSCQSLTSPSFSKNVEQCGKYHRSSPTGFDLR
jgi:hypothetical protein